MACDVPLSSRITRPVDLRLRTLALLRDQPLSRVLDDVLNRALPPAAALAAQLMGQDDGSAPDPAYAEARAELDAALNPERATAVA
jgi:hypothetical protein